MQYPVLTPEQVRQSVGRLPRVPLAHLPTPLEEVSRFARRLEGPRVFIKRDDCTGLLFGGNKTRHNEFLLGEALRQKADCLVWGAGVQSNNCRQTAAACNKLGLECHLILTRVAHNDDIQGNLLLDHLMGAKVEIVDAAMGNELDDLLLARAEEMRKAGRKPFVWDRITGRPIAAVSYVLCMAEIMEQLRALGVEATSIYASAAGATGAGLALGKAILGWKGSVRLLAPIRWPWDTASDMAEVCNQTAKLLDLPHRLVGADIDVRDNFIGSAYGEVTPGSREAMDLMAKTEGLLLDPVYTGKAMAGLIADARSGRLGPKDVAVFIHTGGTPAVFAYRDELVGDTACNR